jgi:hypothetical protein
MDLGAIASIILFMNKPPVPVTLYFDEFRLEGRRDTPSLSLSSRITPWWLVRAAVGSWLVPAAWWLAQAPPRVCRETTRPLAESRV